MLSVKKQRDFLEKLLNKQKNINQISVHIYCVKNKTLRKLPLRFLFSLFTKM
jgi:hypothetical protein